MSISLLVFAASHRPTSYNRRLAWLAAEHARSCGAQIDFAEYSEFDMPLYNDNLGKEKHIPASAHTFLERMKKAHGVIIASPEYNWSYPANLKNIIDWTSSLDITPLKTKTALLLCATPGSRGGMLGLEHLRSPLSALHLQVFSRAYPLGDCENAFSATNQLINDKKSANLQSMVQDYVTFTRKLANS